MPSVRPTVLLGLAVLIAIVAPAVGYDKTRRIEKGVRLHNHGDYEGAMVLYQLVLQDHPHDQRAVYELALSWLERGKDLEELTWIIEAELASGIEQYRELPMLLGAAYDSLGQLEKGETALRRALEGMPENPAAHYNLGVNLSLQRKWADAAEAFQATLQRKADHQGAWFGLGASLDKLDRPARALLAHARAAALDPESARGRASALRMKALLFTRVQEENPGDATKAKRGITITVPAPAQDALEPEAAKGSEADEQVSADPQTVERLALSLVAAQRYLEEWEGKTDAAFFAGALESVVTTFSEPDVAATDPFWTLTLPWLEEARKSGHIEALAYTLGRSAGDQDAVVWIKQHTKQVKAYEEWKTRGPAAS